MNIHSELPVMIANEKSFRVVTLWGQALGIILGLAVGGIFCYAYSFTWLFGYTEQISILLIFAGGLLLGEFVIAPRLNRYRLVTSFDGLHAYLPSLLFPRFTPWHDIHDFTLTDVKPRSFRLSPGGRYRADPSRRVTLRTPKGAYSFKCVKIENEWELSLIMSTHLATLVKGGEGN